MLIPLSLPRPRHFAIVGVNERMVRISRYSDLCGLETLKLRCSMPNLSFARAATKHASSLLTQEIREGQDRFVRCDTDWSAKCIAQLAAIPALGRHLKILSIDLGTNSNFDFDRTFGSSLRNLHASRQYHQPSSTIADAGNPLPLSRNLRGFGVFGRLPYLWSGNQARNRGTRDEARHWIRALIASKRGLEIEEVAVRVEVGRWNGRRDEYRWVAHSTYLYEGVKDERGELVIRDEMHEHSQEWIGIHSFGYWD